MKNRDVMPYPLSNDLKSKRRIVACKQSTLDVLLCDLDMPTIRDAFATLTDYASEILFGEKLDFDDVIVDRFLLVKSEGAGHDKVSADWLSDKNRLIEHVVSFLGKQSTVNVATPVDADDIRIVGLAVDIVQVAGPN